MIDLLVLIGTILLVIYLTYICFIKKKSCKSCSYRMDMKKYYKKAMKESR